MNRNQRSNAFKEAMAKCNKDVLYIIYVVFNKKALSEALYMVLKHMDIVKDYRAYKRVLKDLEASDLIKCKPIEVFDKYGKHEEVVLKQFAINHIAQFLKESPVAVTQTRTATATMLHMAKALYILQWRGAKIAKHGASYWHKLKGTTTFFVPPNKTIKWLDWFGQYVPEHFGSLPQIAENFANVKRFYSEENQKFAQNLLIGSKSSRNKGLKDGASPMLEDGVDLKKMVVSENVQKQTKDNLLDDVTLHKILNNNIYLAVINAGCVTSTGKQLSGVCFKIAIFDVRDDASLRSYLLKLAYVHQYITQILLLDEYDVPFEVDFVALEAQQADNLQEALNNLRLEDLERYGLMLPYGNGNVQISIKNLNLRQSLQKK